MWSRRRDIDHCGGIGRRVGVDVVRRTAEPAPAATQEAPAATSEAVPAPTQAGATGSVPVADPLDALYQECLANGAKVNLIALPDEWANYKGILAAFGEKYPGIEYPVQNPNASSQEELDAIVNLAGQPDMPDAIDGVRPRLKPLSMPASSRSTSRRSMPKSPSISRIPMGTGSLPTTALCRSARTPRSFRTRRGRLPISPNRSTKVWSP